MGKVPGKYIYYRLLEKKNRRYLTKTFQKAIKLDYSVCIYRQIFKNGYRPLQAK